MLAFLIVLCAVIIAYSLIYSVEHLIYYSDENLCSTGKSVGYAFKLIITGKIFAIIFRNLKNVSKDFISGFKIK